MSERGKISVFISRKCQFREIVGHFQETVGKSRKARKKGKNDLSEGLMNQLSIKISMIMTIKTPKYE